jgi:hypothetical protein
LKTKTNTPGPRGPGGGGGAPPKRGADRAIAQLPAAT